MAFYVDGFVTPVPKKNLAVMKKMMADPTFQDPAMMPFDGKRLIFGGFKPLVSAKKKR